MCTPLARAEEVAAKEAALHQAAQQSAEKAEALAAAAAAQAAKEDALGRLAAADGARKAAMRRIAVLQEHNAALLAMVRARQLCTRTAPLWTLHLDADVTSQYLRFALTHAASWYRPAASDVVAGTGAAVGKSMLSDYFMYAVHACRARQRQCITSNCC